MVFGPQVRDGSAGVARRRARTVSDPPLSRHHPHAANASIPVPDWDVAYAVTEGRECINPRPMDEAAIFRTTAAAHDRVHHLLRGLQRRREQGRLERPRLGPGRQRDRHPARLQPLLHRRTASRCLRPWAAGPGTQLAGISARQRCASSTTLDRFPDNGAGRHSG